MKKEGKPKKFRVTYVSEKTKFIRYTTVSALTGLGAAEKVMHELSDCHQVLSVCLETKFS